MATWVTRILPIPKGFVQSSWYMPSGLGLVMVVLRDTEEESGS
jgi:hypothetical protein